MTGRKRRLYLMLAGCVALVLALCLKWHRQPQWPGTETEAGSGSVELRYSITQKNQYDPGVVQLDRSIQFTFPGDSTISLGSLGEMTGWMHASEVEIATRLGRDIKFPQ